MDRFSPSAASRICVDGSHVRMLYPIRTATASSPLQEKFPRAFTSPLVHTGPVRTVDDEGRAVADRVAASRRYADLSQAELAALVGVTRPAIANVENYRVPLRFGLAWRICSRLNVSVWWLWTGEEDRLGFGEPGDEITRRVVRSSEETPFCDVMGELGSLFQPGPAGALAPPGPHLTGAVNSLTISPMQPVLPKLIERLKRATDGYGRKAALAAWLGVHRQCVTDWLSGKQEPGGETTLRLLHWVEAEERKKQSGPGSAATPPGPETQSRVSHEKPKKPSPP